MSADDNRLPDHAPWMSPRVKAMLQLREKPAQRIEALEIIEGKQFLTVRYQGMYQRMVDSGRIEQARKFWETWAREPKPVRAEPSPLRERREKDLEVLERVLRRRNQEPLKRRV